MAPLSAPGAGGELKSEPTTEKRNRAHRLALDGCDGWVITDPPSVGETESVRPYRPSTRGRDAHLLRIFRDHHETLIDRAPGIVTGDRNRSSRCQSSWRRSLPQGGNQEDHQTEIDFEAEEPHRRRCHSFPAPFACATEAQPGAIRLGQVIGAASWLPRKIRDVQATATRTSLVARLVGQVLIDCEKYRPESGIAR